MDNLCFWPFCCKKTEFTCQCSIRQKTCILHASNHVHFPENEFFIESTYNGFESNNDNKSNNDTTLKNSCKRPDKNVMAIIKLIYAKVYCLSTVKFNFYKTNQRSSYCIGLFKNGLIEIEDHDNYLNQLAKRLEHSASINDLPESWMKITMKIKDIEIDIDFYEKLKEVIELENEIKSHWLAKINESPEIIEELKSEFNVKVKKIENWCFKHRNSAESKIIELMNKLTLISELIHNNFEVKYFFRVYKDFLLVYGTESWQKSKFDIFSGYVVFYKYSPSIELPNFKVFCILKDKCACIINLKTMRICKRFSKISVCDQFAFAYYENSVFVFSSSSTNSNFNYLEKYDLTRSIKINMPGPPMNTLCHFYCTIYRNSIIFCIKNSRWLYKFDLIINSYSYLPIAGLYSLSLKFLFTGNNRAYAVDTKSGVFESETDNEYIWNRVSNYETYYYAESIHVSSTNSVYFSIITENYSMNLYKFDLNSKKLYEIESV